MNILMFTNTYTPHVGGVARSVEAFASAYRAAGHRVLVVAPLFDGAPSNEEDVLRLPAVQNFNGSDFSVPVPVPGRLRAPLRHFEPEVIHSHHPFLLGGTALRVAAERRLPVVFTHHTLYERYTHYVPGDSPRLRRAAIELAIGYCNLCAAVIAPSRSIAELLCRRGVVRPIEVVPTGVDVDLFAAGDGSRFRRRLGIREDDFVVGHVGRLAPEKNLELLAAAVADFMAQRGRAHFLVTGDGPLRDRLTRLFHARGLADRLHLVGVLDRRELADAYGAMDVFAFASLTETQGMVLMEAMAAGVPVVALDAPGAREIVGDGRNGRLLTGEDGAGIGAALAWVAARDADERATLARCARATARRFAMEGCAARAVALYRSLPRDGHAAGLEGSAWAAARRRLAEEWRIMRNVAHALDSWRGAPP